MFDITYAEILVCVDDVSREARVAYGDVAQLAVANTCWRQNPRDTTLISHVNNRSNYKKSHCIPLLQRGLAG